jgi:hypothetical protein
LKISKPLKTPKQITPESLSASGTEDGHQAALLCWAAMSVGKYPPLKWLYAIPNGGSRHIVEAMKMVATGTRKGILDLCLPYPIRWNYHGCYIEMKDKKRRNHKDGGCSKEQLEFMEYLSAAGYYFKVCYTWIEARDALIDYMEGRA